MKLDAGKVIDHLKIKWSGRPCNMCGAGNWNVQDAAFEIREYGEGGLTVGGPVLPIVPVVCTNCGNTVLISAVVAKVVSTENEAKR